MLHHSNSLSNKMDNSLLVVGVINHKYIVVEWMYTYLMNKSDLLIGFLGQLEVSY